MSPVRLLEKVFHVLKKFPFSIAEPSAEHMYNSLYAYTALSKLYYDGLTETHSQQIHSSCSLPTQNRCELPEDKKPDEKKNAADAKAQYKCNEYFTRSKYFYYDIDISCNNQRLPQPKAEFKC